MLERMATEGSSDIERWHVGGRYYSVTLATSPDAIDLELDDLGPGVGRGPVAIASQPDETDEISVSVVTVDALPVELLEQFLGEARRILVPDVDGPPGLAG